MKSGRKRFVRKLRIKIKHDFHPTPNSSLTTEIQLVKLGNFFFQNLIIWDKIEVTKFFEKFVVILTSPTSIYILHSIFLPHFGSQAKYTIFFREKIINITRNFEKKVAQSFKMSFFDCLSTQNL